jgi:hypothetical protein
MKLLGIAVLAMAVSPAWAQFGSAGAPPTMSGWGRPSANFNVPVHSGRPFPGGRSNLVFLAEPWLDSYPPQTGPLTYIVLQPQAPVAAKAAEESKPITPLLIEWNGDRFVRTTSAEPLLSNGSPSPQLSAKREARPSAPKTNEPVTLIYRDGHREQVRDYSIVAGRLYASADYVQSGSWMKTINLSALNLPATIETNRASGIEFVLPTAPNVVVAHF